MIYRAFLMAYAENHWFYQNDVETFIDYGLNWSLITSNVAIEVA